MTESVSKKLRTLAMPMFCRWIEEVPESVQWLSVAKNTPPPWLMEEFGVNTQFETAASAD